YDHPLFMYIFLAKQKKRKRKSMTPLRKTLSTLLLALFLAFTVAPAIANVTVYITRTGEKYHAGQRILI
ncbi:hypothetical protein LJC31_06220, partial [Synergistaceae bacterium OttesenSCG-928-I11]|nr:hypothetical protein [Synergistaceae bacterium OttesenSCG-928-I11]